MRTTADHAGDPPEDWEAPGAALVRSAATDRIRSRHWPISAGCTSWASPAPG
jgi:hypothetical protein